jgi:hypothetical protein
MPEGRDAAPLAPLGAALSVPEVCWSVFTCCVVVVRRQTARLREDGARLQRSRTECTPGGMNCRNRGTRWGIPAIDGAIIAGIQIFLTCMHEQGPSGSYIVFAPVTPIAKEISCVAQHSYRLCHSA